MTVFAVPTDSDAALRTFEALGFAASAAMCVMMAVLQWRSSRLMGGGRVHLAFWACGVLWTLPNLARLMLILGGTPSDARILEALVGLAWCSTSSGALIGASAIGGGRRSPRARRIVLSAAAVASAVMFVLTLAVGQGMPFPLQVAEVSLISLALTGAFAVAAGGLGLLRDALTGQGPGRWVVAAGAALAAVELAVTLPSRSLDDPTVNFVAVALGELWPIPWAVLVAAFLARSHYVDVVLKRSLALLGALALSAGLLWPILGPGLSLVLASLATTGLLLAGPALGRLVAVAVDRGLLRRPDYAKLAAAFADEARRAADETELTALAQTRIAEALHLDARFGPVEAPVAPGGVRKTVVVHGRPSALDAVPANPTRTLLEGEHAFLGRVAMEMSRRLEALALEDERREQAVREQALARTAAEAELKALRAQVDTHFLFNTLNAIAALVSTDPEKAEAMTEGLADIFRYALSRHDNAVSTLDEELEFIGKYLAIEQVRFGDRLSVDVALGKGLGGWKVPSLILQPLVENAVRHGLSPRREGGRISISASQVGERLQLRVADDGVGVAKVSGRRQGVGLANVRARLQSLYGEASQMNIGAGADGRGTAVRLLLPAHAG